MLILVFSLLLASPPSDEFAAKLRDGLTALSAGEFPAAQANLEAAAKLKPASAEAWAGLAQTYLKAGNSKSSAAAERAGTLGKSNAAVCHVLAMYYSETGDVHQAAQFERVYALSEHADREALARAGQLALQDNDARGAIPLLETAVKKQPAQADLRRMLASAYAGTGQTDRGIEALRKVVELAPYDEASYFDLGQVLLRQQKFDQAAKVLEQGRRTFDKSAQIELALGVAYYGLRRFTDAAASFFRTMDLAPDVEQPYAYLGRMMDQLGDRLPEFRGRVESWQKVTPKNYLAAFLLAKCRIETGDQLASAEELLRHSIALRGDFWEAHYELATVLEKRRDYLSAAAELQRAIALNPNQAPPHYLLARIYDRLGQADKANAERVLHQKLNAARPNN